MVQNGKKTTYMQYGANIVNTATNELQDNLSSAYSQSKKHKHVVAKKVHFPFCHVRPPSNPARPHLVGGLGWLGFLRRTVSEFSLETQLKSYCRDVGLYMPNVAIKSY